MTPERIAEIKEEFKAFGCLRAKSAEEILATVEAVTRERDGAVEDFHKLNRLKKENWRKPRKMIAGMDCLCSEDIQCLQAYICERCKTLATIDTVASSDIPDAELAGATTTQDLTKADYRIRPCPFCQSRKVLNWLSNDAAPNVWCVFCEACNAEGPHSSSEEEAIRLWNMSPEAACSECERLRRALVNARNHLLTYRLGECGRLGFVYHEFVKEYWAGADPVIAPIDAALASKPTTERGIEE